MLVLFGYISHLGQMFGLLHHISLLIKRVALYIYLKGVIQLLL